LLDFWASWCVPCRKGNPHLIKLYNQYKEQGFEIIGISDDDSKVEAWHKAVEQDKIGIWKHVLRGMDIEKKMKGQSNPGDISEKYNISTLPTKILIDKNGKIIGRYGSEEEDLDKKLAELMPGATARVNGHIRNLKDSITFYWNDETGPKSETVKVVDEKFTWIKNFTSPQKIMLATRMRYMQFFVENKAITIEGNADSLYYSKVTGSATQDEFVKYNQSIEPIRAAQYKLFSELRKTENQALKAELQRKVDSIDSVVDDRRKSYVKNNANSPVSVSLVEDVSIVGEYGKVNEYFQLLSGQAKQTTTGKRLADRVEVLKRSTIGSYVKDFTMNSMDGKTIRMSDFKGKYLFIDFWASWCGPCRAENPNVLKAYENYKDKSFAVLGISIDDNTGKWKEAVEKDKMPWTQVLNNKGSENDVAAYYGIQAIPSTMLLDADGKIIALNLRGEKLHEELQKVLK
jgi:thiol-disulfide isomerase/thioredoxin